MAQKKEKIEKNDPNWTNSHGPVEEAIKE